MTLLLITINIYICINNTFADITIDIEYAVDVCIYTNEIYGTNVNYMKKNNRVNANVNVTGKNANV